MIYILKKPKKEVKLKEKETCAVVTDPTVIDQNMAQSRSQVRVCK